MIPVEQWKWFGHAGHLFVSYDCRFHLATQVGQFWISTVGEYRPEYAGYNSDNYELDKGKGIGIMWKSAEDKDYRDAIFETMVFPITGKHECGCPEWSPGEIDMDRYLTHTDAQRGHMELCLKAARGEYPMGGE